MCFTLPFQVLRTNMAVTKCIMAIVSSFFNKNILLSHAEGDQHIEDGLHYIQRMINFGGGSEKRCPKLLRVYYM